MPRVALITCATRFAGRPAARALLAAGMKVVCHDDAFADATVRGAFAADVPGCDTVQAAGYEETFAAAQAVHGQIDVLVSNDAHPADRVPVAEVSAEAFRETLEDLAVRPLMMAKQAAPGMKARGYGRIIFVSSAAPLRGLANYAMYVAARAACNGLVSSLAKELGKSGITVNAVASNYVENPDYFPPALLADMAAMAKMTANIPLQRLGKPEEIAATIAFLASDGAGFITGQVIGHAGGWA
jgi:NAD(P)-dependent dehydrogenase (short-subunit alcohol dehydrogenase family)